MLKKTVRRIHIKEVLKNRELGEREKYSDVCAARKIIS